MSQWPRARVASRASSRHERLITRLSQVPQLRLYLRPAAIRVATTKQWEEELPPFEVEFNSKGQQVTLMDKFQAYLARVRNQKNIQICEISGFQMFQIQIAISFAISSAIQIAISAISSAQSRNSLAISAISKCHKGK